MRFSPMSRSSLGRVLLGGLAAGAGLMYLLDPEQGDRRRAVARDRAARALRALCAAGAGARAALCAHVSDQFLAERVRSEITLVVAHPASIQVNARHGRVTLWGPVLRGEVEALRRRLTALCGVRALELQLTPHGVPGGWRIQSRREQLRAG